MLPDARVRLPAWLACLALAGCASPPRPRPAPVADASATRAGDVSARAIDSEQSARYPSSDALRYVLPEAAAANATPAYPPSLLARRLPPVRVRARIVVDTTGAVVGVSALGEREPEHAPFEAATTAALRGWRFSPLLRIAADAGAAEALPFHLVYEFEFTQREGRPVVTGAARATP